MQTALKKIWRCIKVQNVPNLWIDLCIIDFLNAKSCHEMLFFPFYIILLMANYSHRKIMSSMRLEIFRTYVRNDYVFKEMC